LKITKDSQFFWKETQGICSNASYINQPVSDWLISFFVSAISTHFFHLRASHLLLLVRELLFLMMKIFSLKKWKSWFPAAYWPLSNATAVTFLPFVRSFVPREQLIAVGHLWRCLGKMEDAKPNVAASGTGEAKPEAGAESAQINLKVRDADGNEVQFKVRRMCVYVWMVTRPVHEDHLIRLLIFSIFISYFFCLVGRSRRQHNWRSSCTQSPRIPALRHTLLTDVGFYWRNFLAAIILMDIA
jgi:hypothetical protein